MSTLSVGTDDVRRIGERLAPTGLNRCQAVSVAGLPASVWLDPQPPSALTESGSGSATLLLIGHGGRALWDHLHGSDFDFHGTGDPIDTFSVKATNEALAVELPHVGRRLLYPEPACPVDLVALGRHIGWLAPSPLGLGIHPEFGLWSAFRALWLLEAASEISPRPRAPDVCQSCVPQSCVAACPANAVTVDRRFNLGSCTDYRSNIQSACADTCLSRLACPEGAEHRYGDAQLSYHYRLTRPPVR